MSISWIKHTDKSITGNYALTVTAVWQQYMFLALILGY